MNKCFAYEEIIRNGKKKAGCSILCIDAFESVHKKFGGCCARNCKFYKESRDQGRTDKGIFYLTDKQKRIQRQAYELNYKGLPNIHEYE